MPTYERFEDLPVWQEAIRLAGEVRSMLCFFERRPVMRDFKSRISNLKSRAESCSRQLRAWADHLQNSEIKGQRHLNDTTRDQFAKRQTKVAAAQQWDGMVRQQIQKLAPDHPMRVQWEQKHGPAGEGWGDLKSEI